MASDQMSLPNAPEISGLRFRHFRGEDDYPQMVAANLASAQADGVETTLTVEFITQAFQNLTNCDPYQDILIAEADGKIIGYSRGSWVDEPEGCMYQHIGVLVPAWRRKGIGSAILQWMETHLREVAATHPPEMVKFFRPNGISYRETGRITMLERAGYRPIRFFHNMVRPTLDDIQEFPLPVGLEVRPALPEHYRAIWTQVDNTSKDEWGYSEPTEEKYQEWLTDPHFQPDLWQVAWDVATEKPIGSVLTFIDHAENEKYNRKRGYTEGIGVVHAWRRQGIARALIALSLQAQKAAGMTESALVADSDSVSNVTHLYESCGFQTIYTDSIYRKPF